MLAHGRIKSMKSAPLAACLCVLLVSCSAYGSLEELKRHADDHATSSLGYGYNVYVDKGSSTFEVALDARSALTAAVGFTPPEADADAVAKHWAVMNRPRCQAEKAGKISSDRFLYKIAC
jgi:hypothetical protein